MGAIGAITARSFAQTSQPPAQPQATEAPVKEEALGTDIDNVEEQVGVQDETDTGEAVNAPDTDNVEEQVGNQDEIDIGEAVNAPDTDNVEEQVGDQNAPDTGAEVNEVEDEKDTTPIGTAAITADQAKATAEAYLNSGTATQVKLDDENGQLVYSVEIGASEVKVDAMTGAVLGVETGEDQQN